MAFFFFLHTHVTHADAALSPPPTLLFGLLGQPLREPRDGVGGLHPRHLVDGGVEQRRERVLRDVLERGERGAGGGGGGATGGAGWMVASKKRCGCGLPGEAATRSSGCGSSMPTPSVHTWTAATPTAAQRKAVLSRRTCASSKGIVSEREPMPLALHSASIIAANCGTCLPLPKEASSA